MMEISKVSPRDRKLLLDLRNIVEDHLSEPEFDVQDFAACMGKNRITLYRILKRSTGQSAGEFIRVIRLEHAAVLLKQGEVRIHQAAEMSGFGNLSYFAKCFREKYGCRPSEFRLLEVKKIFTPSASSSP